MSSSIALAGRSHDLGDGFTVRRLLPDVRCRSVGPFVFVDHMGPHRFPAGRGIDVRPHPHIGLSTLTWLFDGVMMHRDSLGSVQAIRPGDVNWMTAGRGIVHSERTPEPERSAGHRIEGLQTWLALPDGDAEAAPSFQHVPASEVPSTDCGGVAVTVIAGEAYGLRSPVRVFVPTLFVAVEFPPGGVLELEDRHEERAVLPLDVGIELDGRPLEPRQLHVLQDRKTATLRSRSPARAMILGGSPVGPRRLWWNFVASSAERIEQAKADWVAGRFATVPGEAEAIPLPE